jgi:hypothetical protein
MEGLIPHTGDPADALIMDPPAANRRDARDRRFRGDRRKVANSWRYAVLHERRSGFTRREGGDRRD